MLVVTFQVGSERLALDVRRVHEIVPCVRLQAVACGPPWLAGVFIYRGQIVPVIDLHHLLRMGDCPVHLSTRILLVPHRGDGQERLVGLLAAEVADVREIPPPSPTASGLEAPGRLSLGPVFVDGKEIIHLVELERLLPGLSDEQLALVAKEPFV
jgi:chemotaxis-related protein WspB